MFFLSSSLLVHCLQENLRLRTWAEGELHSANPRARAVLHSAADKTLHVADAFRIGSKCEASECLLIGKDLWARGRGKVYMNPRVRVYYNAETVFWQQWVLPAFNRWFFSWYNSFPVAKAPATAAATPALAADASDASAPVFEAARTEAPLSVECGDSMRNDVTAYSFVVAAVLLLALLLVPAVILYRLSKLCVSSAALGSSRSASATSFMPLPSGVADSAADRAGRSEGAVARLMFWARCCRRGKAHTV